MKELGLVLAGMAMGWAAEGMWPVIRNSVRGWRKPQQWFRRSEPARRPSPVPPGAAPGPRPVVGQRPSEGAHRATQRRARFVGRSYRSRRE